MRTLSRAVALAAMALSVACGGAGSPPAGGAAATVEPAAPDATAVAGAAAPSDAAAAQAAAGEWPPPAAEAPPGAIVLPERSDHAAELQQVRLSELNIPEPHDDATATASGAVAKVLVKNGTLRYVTAGDSGRSETGQVRIVSNGKMYVVPFIVWSSMPSVANSPDHGGEGAATTPALVHSGLGPHNAIGTQPIRFTTIDRAPLDPEDSTGRIIDSRGREINARDYWAYDAADRSFTIAGAALQRFRDALAPGIVEMNLNFRNSRAGVGRVYEFPAVRADARLVGRLVTRGGAPATRLAGVPVLLRSYDHRSVGFQLRRLATVAADGTFAFDDLIPGVYDVAFGDLVNFGLLGATVEIYPDSTAVSATIVDFVASRAERAVSTKGAESPDQIFHHVVEQDGNPRPAAGTAIRKGVPAPGVAPTGKDASVSGSVAPTGKDASVSGSVAVRQDASCAGRLPDGTATFIAMSHERGKESTCEVSFTVPPGTAQVGVEVHVGTLEHPKYTRAGSDYNDTWRFSVQDLGVDYLSVSNAVNKSHDELGTRKWYACVDMRKRAADAPVTLTGSAAATGVGDSLHPTSVRILIGTRCNLEFKVVSARLLSPAASGNFLIGPDTSLGNAAGRYLSMVSDRVSPLYKLPMRIAYHPASARIDKVELGLQHGTAAPVFAADNLLAQTATVRPGEIEFAGMNLPQWPLGRTPGLVRLVVRLTGTLDGRSVVSDAATGGRVVFGTDETFTPLYQVDDEPGLASRRYGGRPDPGGDAWATVQTIAWLASKPYRYNDVSAQHVLQTPRRRSVLDHRGHSDGQQIDLRYADGQGGYEDAMGGANHGSHIRAVLQRARDEVRSDAPHKPNLARITAWLQANRRIIGEQAAAPEVRKIHVGKEWMEDALIKGRFSDGTPIPGVGAWAHSEKIQPAESHLHHWHISLNAAPPVETAPSR